MRLSAPAPEMNKAGLTYKNVFHVHIDKQPLQGQITRCKEFPVGTEAGFIHPSLAKILIYGNH